MEVSEGIALEVLREVGVTGPVDAREICEACGVEVRAWKYPFGMRSGDAVWYPERAPIERRQFTIAHELGHWLLEDYGLDPANEDRANRIAAALLMPRDMFRDASMGGGVYELAPRFGVHQTAAALRLAEAGVCAASIVVTPKKVHARGVTWELPGDDAVRAGRLNAPGLARVTLTDAPDRVAYFAG